MFSNSFSPRFAISIKHKLLFSMNNSIGCFNRPFSLSPQPLRPVALPKPMETHLWCLNPEEVKDTLLLDKYMKMLPPCEQKNVLSFKEGDHRKRALLARALVRTTISRYQTNPCFDPRSLKFKKNMYGKPEVDWQCTSDEIPPLHFNMSHTSSLIACGITTNSPIGIDVEEKRRPLKNNVMTLARRFFCDHEVEHLANISDHEMQHQEFLKLWTLKEAYVKALGKGFSASPFNTFRIQFKAPSECDVSKSPHKSMVSEIVVESSDDQNSKWQLALMELNDSHYASICMKKPLGSEEIDESLMNLRVWKTVPFLEDLGISGTRSVVTVGGFVQQLQSLNSAL